MENKQYSEAVKYYEESLKIDPENISTLLFGANIMLKLDDIENATKVF